MNTFLLYLQNIKKQLKIISALLWKRNLGWMF